MPLRKEAPCSSILLCPTSSHAFELASLGIGTRFHLYNHFNGALDLGVPLISQTETDAFDPLLTFRVWADF